MTDHNLLAAAIGGFMVGLLVGLVVATTAGCDETRTRAAVWVVEATRPHLAVRVPEPAPYPDLGVG